MESTFESKNKKRWKEDILERLIKTCENKDPPKKKKKKFT